MERERIPELVRQAQSGDGQAMEELLKAAHTYVSYQCREFMKHTEDAEDMTQEVLIKIYNSLDSLEEPEKFISWANRIAARHCINERRRNPKDLQFAEDGEGNSLMDGLEESDEQKIPDSAIDRAETARMMARLVNELPEAQRMCTYLFYYDGMSVNEIAELIGVSGNTVKSRLNYARKSIKGGVLDYEKQGVKLYGLSPLPFIAFFLRRAAESGADEAAASAMVRRVLSAPAAAGSASAGTAAKSAGFFGTVAGKIVAAVAAVAVIACGVAVVANLPEKDEPEETPPPVVETAAVEGPEAPNPPEIEPPLLDSEADEIPEFTMQVLSIDSEYLESVIEYPVFKSESAGYEAINQYIEQEAQEIFDFQNRVLQEGTPAAGGKNSFAYHGINRVLPKKATYNVKSQNDRYLTVELQQITEYAGVYPELSYSFYYTFDVKTGKKLLLDDVLDGSRQEILDMIDEKLRQSPDVSQEAYEAYKVMMELASSLDSSTGAVTPDNLFYIEDGQIWYAFDFLNSTAVPIANVGERAHSSGLGEPAGEEPVEEPEEDPKITEAFTPLENTQSGLPACTIHRTALNEQYGYASYYVETPLFDSDEPGYKAINSMFEELHRQWADYCIAAYGQDSTGDAGAIPGCFFKCELFSQDERFVSVSCGHTWWGANESSRTYYTLDVQTGEQADITDLVEGTREEIINMIMGKIKSEYGHVYYGVHTYDPEFFNNNFYIWDGEVSYVWNIDETIDPIHISLPLKSE